MAMDWLMRVYTPAWLELAGLPDAAALRALAPVLDERTLHAALPALERARAEAHSRRAARMERRPRPPAARPPARQPGVAQVPPRGPRRGWPWATWPATAPGPPPGRPRRT